MNTKLLLLVVSVAAFSSCTTLYKSGQTPDDVYYSPARPDGGYYVDQRKDDQTEPLNSYSSEYRTIRLGINDPRWRYLDNNYSSDFYINDYSYSPYNYGYNYGYYYNPFYYPYPVYGYGYGSVFVTPSLPKNTTPRVTNLSAYNPVYNNSTHPSMNNPRTGLTPVRTYNNSNRGSAVGNVMRQIFTPSNNTPSNNSVNNPSSNTNRTYTPAASSSSSSSGSSSSGGGGGAISRPPRN